MKLLFPKLSNLNGPILITGHTGFKGTWLSLMLKQLDVEVIGLSLPAEERSLASRVPSTLWAKEYFVDIRDRAAVTEVFRNTNPQFVFHLAAQALVLTSYSEPVETFGTNVMGTVHILESAFNERSVKGVVISTTDKVYKNVNDARRFVESDPLGGSDPYSSSKVGTEAVISAWQSLRDSIGGPAVCAVRSGNVIGGGDIARNRLLPDLVDGFSKGQKIEIRNPLSTRPWQHVADPLFGYLLTAESILEGNYPKSYNFGPLEQSLSVSEVIGIARKAWSGETEIEIAQSQTNQYEAKLLELDSTLSRNELDWRSKFTQVESVTATMTWWDKVLNHEVPPIEACLEDLERYEK